MQKNIESPPILEPVTVRYISNLYKHTHYDGVDFVCAYDQYVLSWPGNM